MLNFYLHRATTGISDKLQLIFKDKSCMWLFRTSPSIPAQNSATFLWLTSATELSAFFFFPQLPDILQKKKIILTKKKFTTNRIAYISVHKAALCYWSMFLLFSCSLPHLLCLPSSVIITSLCYVSRKILLWTISLYFYIWETVFLTTGAVIIAEEDLTYSPGFQTGLAEKWGLSLGKTFMEYKL